MKHILVLGLAGLLGLGQRPAALAQQAPSPYRTRFGQDAPRTLALAGLSATGLYLVQRKRVATPAELAALPLRAGGGGACAAGRWRLTRFLAGMWRTWRRSRFWRGRFFTTSTPARGPSPTCGARRRPCRRWWPTSAARRRQALPHRQPGGRGALVYYLG